MPEIVGSWLLTGHGPGQPGLVPDPGKYLSGRGPGDLVAGGGDEEVRPAGEPCAGLLVARVEDPRDWGVTGSLRLRFPLDQTMSMFS